MKKAFTLAEVLITLAIIGVVAALTIPVVVHKYQQKQLYTQFMKTYNIISNVVNLSVAEYGYPSIWAYDSENSGATVEQYLAPYLNVISKCTAGDSGCADYKLSALTGGDLGIYGQLFSAMGAGTPNVYTLADGSSVTFFFDINASILEKIMVAIDTNGSKKPNTFGRDVFLMQYMGEYTYGYDRYIEKWIWSGTYHFDNPDIPSTCDSSSSDMIMGMLPNGSGCGERILEEGKMDY